MRTIRSWYVNVLSSPFAGWSLPWASIILSGSVSLQTQDQVSTSDCYLFQISLTTLSTLAWTLQNFSSTGDHLPGSNHLPSLNVTGVRQADTQVSWWHLQWIGFCRVKMTWPRGYWWVSGPILLSTPGQFLKFHWSRKVIFWRTLCTRHLRRPWAYREEVKINNLCFQKSLILRTTSFPSPSFFSLHKEWMFNLGLRLYSFIFQNDR